MTAAVLAFPTTERSPSAFVQLVAGALRGGNAVLTQNTDDIDTSANRLSQLFSQLSEASHKQTSRLAELALSVSSVDVGGKKVSLVELPQLIQSSVQDVAQQIMVMSKQGVTLVYAMDDVLDEIQDLEKLVTEIGQINSQTRLLSLNARIESERLNSAEFKIVATEMNALSRQVDSLAGRMRKTINTLRDHVTRLIDQIKDEYRRMSSIGAMDMTSQIDANTYLERLMEALVAHNAEIGATIGVSAEASQAIGDHVNEVVVAMQFQDRVRQRAENVCEALQMISQFIHDSPLGFSDEDACNALRDRILAQTRMSEVKRVFARELFDQAGEQLRTEESDPGVELF